MMKPTLDQLHAALRASVKRILRQSGAEHQEWRVMALREAYEQYGKKADAIRGIK